jgi:methyltransferase
MEINTETLFLVTVIFTAVQRILELFISKRNVGSLIKKGGKVIKEKNYIAMVLLHTSWIIILLYNGFNNKNIINENYFYIFFGSFCLGQFLRITAITTLGERWTTQIVVLPEAPVIKKGLFTFIRHPNYLGVVIEILSLPMMGGLYLIAFVFSALNLIILYFRIKLEEKSLREYNNYDTVFS